MYLIVAGKDRASDIGSDLTRRAGRHQGPLSRWSPADSALSLKTSRDAGEYLERYCRLLRLRYSVSTESFPIPGKAGIGGTILRTVKAFLWKLLRYQHDRMAFQQNAINELVIGSVDFQRTLARQSQAAVEQRVRALEAEVAALRQKGNP